MTRVTMPQLGETVAEGTVMTWHKDVGDEVEVGELLFEVATDKVDTEVEATAAGVLREILVPAGETVAVGTPLAVLGDGDAEPAEEDPAEAPATPAAQIVAEASDAAVPPPEHGSTEVPGASPVAPAAAATPAPAVEPAPLAPNSRHNASPLVRRLAREAGLDVTGLTGTGPDGRVVRADVEAAVPGAEPDASPLVGGVAPAVRQGRRDDLPDDVDVVPFSTVRRRTAEHMVRSRATSAHAFMAVEVDFHAVDAVRRQAGLTYLPFVARAVVTAIVDHPHVNAQVGDDALLVHRRVHLGIAVDLDADGLVVPVLRDAGDLRLPALGRRIGELAAGAREHRLGPDAYAGGTFTISNPGPYGTLLTAPIIAQPQVAILATDAVRAKPVAVPVADGGHAIAVHPVGTIGLSFDHRVVDGGYAARFLRRVQEVLETRDWSAER